MTKIDLYAMRIADLLRDRGEKVNKKNFAELTNHLPAKYRNNDELYQLIKSKLFQ